MQNFNGKVVLMRFLSKTLKTGVANRLALTIVAVSAVAFLWAVAVAKDIKPTEKTEQIVSNKQKAEAQVLQEKKNKLQIGIYNPQQTFNMYYGTQNLRKQIQQLQTEKKMTQEQLQQMVKQKQQQLIQQFQNDLRKVVPQLAKDANVPVIAIQVVYREPSVEIKDLTAELANKINQLAEQTGKGKEQPVLKQPLLPGTEQK